MNIAIVTDSTADIPSTLSNRYRITVVPAVLMIGDQTFEDGKGLTREAFYNQLPGMNPLPTTGTPSVGVFENIYQNLLDHGAQQVISIHVASILSGIYSTAKLAAQPFEGHVTVIDSESLSMGIGFQVLAAAEAAIANSKIEQIIDNVEKTRSKTRLFAMLDTLEFVHRSGRVGWARARIGSVLRIKPFLEVKSGKVISMGQTRTRKKGIRQLKHLLLEQGSVERLAILHTNAEQDAIAFLEDLAWVGKDEPLIVNVTTIIGTHVGPGGLGFAAVLH